MIVGLCCEYCIKHETNDCPVDNASPWSRWANFCNEFVDNKNRTISSFMNIVKLKEASNES